MLAQFLPPRKFGGEERHVWTLAKGLVGRGHEVTLLGFDTDGVEPADSILDGVRLIRVTTAASRVPFVYTDKALPYATPMPDPLVRQAIGRVLADNEFDLIHAHNWIVNSAMSPATGAGVPLVMTLHDYSHVCATKRLMEFDDHVCRGPAVRRCVPCSASFYGPVKGTLTLAANTWASRRRASAVTRFAAVSTAVANGVSLDDTAGRRRLSATGVDAEVIPNFIPDDIIVEGPPPLDAGGPIAFAGDIQPDKGVHTLLEAYSLLDDPPPLIFAGRKTPATPPFFHDDGTGQPVPEGAWRIPKGVEFVGAVSHEEVLKLFRSARVVVVPSVFADPCPTVVLEGMASGRPVVGAASGGISELVVDGVTGSLFPAGDAPALARAIDRLLEDGRLAQAFGLAGRERARDFTLTSVVDRLELMYRSAVDAVAPVKGGRAT